VGTAGVVITLLSAGIDSPVSTWRMMRRGADPVAVHFHGQPFTDRSSEQKVTQLIGVLVRWGYRRPWWSVPMGEAQREITLSRRPSSLRVLLYRRLMLRVAEGIATRHGALAVVTGESLGQVASQTLENMAAVGSVATLPLLRPLVGTDKVEIIDEGPPGRQLRRERLRPPGLLHAVRAPRIPPPTPAPPSSTRPKPVTTWRRWWPTVSSVPNAVHRRSGRVPLRGQ